MNKTVIINGKECPIKYNKQYLITECTLHDAVNKFTRTIMKGQKGWNKDENLLFLEYEIEGIIRRHLNNFHGIKFEE